MTSTAANSTAIPSGPPSNRAPPSQATSGHAPGSDCGPRAMPVARGPFLVCFLLPDGGGSRRRDDSAGVRGLAVLDSHAGAEQHLGEQEHHHDEPADQGQQRPGPAHGEPEDQERDQREGPDSGRVDAEPSSGRRVPSKRLPTCACSRASSRTHGLWRLVGVASEVGEPGAAHDEPRHGRPERTAKARNGQQVAPDGRRSGRSRGAPRPHRRRSPARRGIPKFVAVSRMRDTATIQPTAGPDRSSTIGQPDQERPELARRGPPATAKRCEGQQHALSDATTTTGDIPGRHR